MKCGWIVGNLQGNCGDICSSALSPRRSGEGGAGSYRRWLREQTQSSPWTARVFGMGAKSVCGTDKSIGGCLISKRGELYKSGVGQCSMSYSPRCGASRPIVKRLGGGGIWGVGGRGAGAELPVVSAALAHLSNRSRASGQPRFGREPAHAGSWCWKMDDRLECRLRILIRLDAGFAVLNSGWGLRPGVWPQLMDVPEHGVHSAQIYLLQGLRATRRHHQENQLRVEMV